MTHPDKTPATAEVIPLSRSRDPSPASIRSASGAAASGNGAEESARRPMTDELPGGTTEVLALLIARVAQGDRGAFRALFELVRSPVFGVCLRMLRNRGEAEEVLQDVFVRLWRNAASFRGEASRSMAWILAIARNRCLEILRRRGVDDGEFDAEAVDALVDEAPTPEQRSVDAEGKRSIAECLGALDPLQRQAIELAFYDGLSYREAAERLARPVGTVKSQIRRGLARLKQCLQTR